MKQSNRLVAAAEGLTEEKEKTNEKRFSQNENLHFSHTNTDAN